MRGARTNDTSKDIACGLAAHRRPLEQRPDIGATATTGLEGKPGLQIRQADVIAPRIGIQDDRVRAFEVAAVDQQPARVVVGKHAGSRWRAFA